MWTRSCRFVFVLRLEAKPTNEISTKVNTTKGFTKLINNVDCAMRRLGIKLGIKIMLFKGRAIKQKVELTNYSVRS